MKTKLITNNNKDDTVSTPNWSWSDWYYVQRGRKGSMKVTIEKNRPIYFPDR